MTVDASLKGAAARRAVSRSRQAFVIQALVMRFAPGVRAIQPDLFGPEFRDQPLSDGLKQRIVQQYHGVLVADDPRGGKPKAPDVGP